jgi:4-hydroxythreonine-4-phosphate dehydrogenase
MDYSQKIRVAITQGDTNGVGYEQIFKTFEDPAMLELCTPIVYGSPKVATYHHNALESQLQFSIIASAEEAKDSRLNILTTCDEEIKVDFGTSSAEATEAARVALKQAIMDVQQGKADVRVMAPDTLPDFLSKEPEVLKVRMAGDIRVGLITNLMALKDVPEAITRQKIVEKTKVMHHTLHRDLRISAPRIAILSLNPPAEGDAKWEEEEEKEVIIPAIQELQDAGLQVFGPYAADHLFGSSDYLCFDAVMAMYYGQGMTPLKSIAPPPIITLASGMPFVCTMTETGVEYEIAGKGCADEAPLRQAVYTAIDVFRNRHNYDEALANPLPKIYKERRDDSEKVRFAVPRKKEERNEEKN